MGRTRVLVLAGGQSEEHEVSLSSSRSLLSAVEGTDLDPTVVVITRAGRWLSPADSQKALTAGKATSGGELTLRSAQVTEQFDVVFPLIHGPHGEDGTVQGMLELAGLPYVGSGVLASALCMDKPMSRMVLTQAGLPQLPSALVTRHQWQHQTDDALARCAALRGPWFVKPANLGSSVGVSKAHDEAELRGGLDKALALDRRAIVEQGLPDARELETAVLGNDDPEASPVGEITYDAEWYDYATKYTEGHAQLHIPADIPGDLAERIRALGLQAFRELDCAGFARVDFLYRTQTEELYINEVNTIPGFTPFSMYTKLWEHAGIPYGELVERLVALALERHAG